MPDKTPQALVVGGYPQDRAEIMSRMAGCGWQVKEHWINNEGGHDYSRLPRDVKLIIAMREFLDNKQYVKTCTLADISKVPIVKWDIDRHKFRQRLSKIGLLFEPPKPQPPPAPPPEQVMPPAAPLEVTEPVVVPPRRQDFDALCELMWTELATHPLFMGVSIVVAEDGLSAEIQPMARKFVLGERRPMEKVLTEPVQLAAPRKPPEPPPEPPRPVEMPCPPRIENPPPPAVKESKEEPSGPHRFRKGMKLNMVCRYPGCTAKGMGPRFQWHCRAHQDIPMRQKKINMAVWSKTHKSTL